MDRQAAKARWQTLQTVPACGWSWLALACVMLLLLAACGGANTTPDAHQLISQAQSAIQKVSSYHFNLAVDNPGTGGSLVIKNANGDILVPDKLKATANVLVLSSVVQVQMISIDSQQYVTNPITGTWMPATGLLDPRTLSNSRTGVASILGHIQNPTTPKDSSANGTSCWSIDGTLDSQYLSGITGGGTPTGSKVAVTTCIGKSDHLPYLIRITGIATQGDSAKTVRTFTLSKFNEQLTITAPI